MKNFVLLACLLSMQESFAQETVFSLDIMPLWSWQIIFLAMWCLLWLACMRKKSSNKKYLLLILSFIVVTTSIPVIMGYYKESETVGMVRAEDTCLYVGPDKSYPVRAMLPNLAQVTIIKKENIWYYTDSACGKGWLIADAVEIIA